MTKDKQNNVLQQILLRFYEEWYTYDHGGETYQDPHEAFYKAIKAIKRTMKYD